MTASRRDREPQFEKCELTFLDAEAAGTQPVDTRILEHYQPPRVASIKLCVCSRMQANSGETGVIVSRVG